MGIQKYPNCEKLTNLITLLLSWICATTLIPVVVVQLSMTAVSITFPFKEKSEYLKRNFYFSFQL
jgi:hypothetical protein